MILSYLLAASIGLFSDGMECLDTDKDRVPDCHETIYYGTDPTLVDTDADGIKDGDELFTTEAGLNLRAMGASPTKKNIFVEYDWYESSPPDCPTALSHKPSAATQEKIRLIFANAPVINPDGTTGIALIQDDGRFGGGNLLPGRGMMSGSLGSNVGPIKADHFNPNRLGYFRYVIHAHTGPGGNVGLAELGGDDAVIAQRCHATDFTKAALTTHEIGHTLNLNHGGAPSDKCNNKPNYNSLMNYRFNYGADVNCDGKQSFGEVINFSPGTNRDLNENALDEVAGVCGTTPIDFNEDGLIATGVKYNLNPESDVDCNGEFTFLRDYNDWIIMSLPIIHAKAKSLPEIVID